MARTVYIHTVYDRIFGEFYAKNAVYAPHIYGSGNPTYIPSTQSSRYSAVAVPPGVYGLVESLRRELQWINMHKGGEKFEGRM